jgi:hypothetical protein
MEETKSDFFIEIKFKKDSENPSRVFKAMSDLIDAFQELDNDLIKGIDSKLEPIILLEDVEIGSLRAWLLNVIKGVPDEIIKDGDWKKILGHYLVKSKYILINRLEGYTEISDAKIIKDIQLEIEQEARKTNFKSFPSYAPLSIPTLIKNINNIHKSLNVLNKADDSAFFHSTLGEAHFNLKLGFSPADIEDLLTKEKIENTTQLILKVKKPDYLGHSMWDFKYDGKLISAKILHADWLCKFQKREIDIRPGDSMRTKLNTIVKYGYDNEVVGLSYEIKEVLEIVPMTVFEQGEIEF